MAEPFRILRCRSPQSLRDQAVAALHAPSSQGTWLLASTRRAADDLAREAALQGPLWGVHRASCLQAAAAWSDTQPFASDLARTALVRQLLAEADLDIYAPFKDRPGFAAALAETFQELRSFQLSSNDWLPLGDDFRELKKLYLHHERVMEELGWADATAVLQQAVVPEGIRVQVVDLALETPVEWAFMERIAQGAGSVWVVLRASDPRSQTWERILGVEVEEMDDHAASPSFSWFASPSEHQEALDVARSIQESSDPFDQMAVVVRTRAQQVALEAALSAAAIPAFFSRGSRRPDPRGRAFLALLQCAEERLSAARFAEYLSFGQVPPQQADGSVEAVPVPWVPPDDAFQLGFATSAPPARSGERGEDGAVEITVRWEQWLTEAAVVGSRDRWERRLTGLMRELELQMQVPDAPVERITQDLRSLGRFKAFALPLVSELDDLAQRPRTWGQWQEALERVATRGLADPTGVLEALAELRPMASVGPATLADVRSVLEPRLKDLRSEPPSDAYGQVFVGTPDEMRGRSFETVFMPGLSEGRFPTPVRPDPILPDADRARLHPELPRAPRHRVAERDRFAAACFAASSLTLSYARQHPTQEKAQIPSQFFLNGVLEHTGDLPEFRELLAPDSTQAAFGPSWLVPVDPRRAVFAGEYDVAVARRLRQWDPSERRGWLRYLFDSELPAAAQSLRARFGRWSPKTSVYDGAMFTEEPMPRLSDGVWSASALQTFAECPYKFWLSAILRFRPRPPVLAPQTLDPLTRGSLFHAVQLELFRRAGGSLPDEALVVRTVQEVGDRFAEAVAPAIPPVFEQELARIESDLVGWYRLQTGAGDGFRPRHAELGFGLPPDPDGHDPASVRAPVELRKGFRVRGSMDLVEEHESGELRVTDFKTSKTVPWMERVHQGRTLQPALYAMALERLFRRPVRSGRLAYATAKAGFKTLDVPHDPETQRRFWMVMDCIEDHLKAGHLPADPLKGLGCDFCDFRRLCGPLEPERVSRKVQLVRVRRAQLQELK